MSKNLKLKNIAQTVKAFFLIGFLVVEFLGFGITNQALAANCTATIDFIPTLTYDSSGSSIQLKGAVTLYNLYQSTSNNKWYCNPGTSTNNLGQPGVSIGFNKDGNINNGITDNYFIYISTAGQASKAFQFSTTISAESAGASLGQTVNLQACVFPTSTSGDTAKLVCSQIIPITNRAPDVVPGGNGSGNFTIAPTSGSVASGGNVIVGWSGFTGLPIGAQISVSVNGQKLNPYPVNQPFATIAATAANGFKLDGSAESIHAIVVTSGGDQIPNMPDLSTIVKAAGANGSGGATMYGCEAITNKIFTCATDPKSATIKDCPDPSQIVTPADKCGCTQVDYDAKRCPGGRGSTPPATDKLYNPLPEEELTHAFLVIAQGFLSITGIWAVIFIIIGGFQMVTAAGNEEMYLKAKKTIIWAVLGVALSAMSFSIIAITQRILRTNIDTAPLNQTSK